jgi:WD40 repeat protein
VRSLAVLSDGRLASGGHAAIKVWPKDGAGQPLILKGKDYPLNVFSLVALPDGQLASAGWDILVLDRNGKVETKVEECIDLDFCGSGPFSVMTALTGGILVVGDKSKEIIALSWKGNIRSSVLKQTSAVDSLAVLADGRLASGDEDGQIWLWPKEATGEHIVLSAGAPVYAVRHQHL